MYIVTQDSLEGSLKKPGIIFKNRTRRAPHYYFRVFCVTVLHAYNFEEYNFEWRIPQVVCPYG